MQKPLPRLLILILLLWVPILLSAGEIRLNNDKPGLTIKSSTPQSLTIETRLSSLLYRDVDTQTGTFSEVFAEAFGYSNEVGSPKLPVLRKLIEVPAGSGFSIIINKTKFTEINCFEKGIAHVIIPAQAPVSKGITDATQIPFVFNSAVYQQNALLGGPLVTVEPVGQMRALNMARLDVSPVTYNPVTGILRIYEEIEATIIFDNGNTDATTSMKRQTASPYFEKTYRQIINYPGVTDELITTSPVTYVIVSDPCSRPPSSPSSTGKHVKVQGHPGLYQRPSRRHHHDLHQGLPPRTLQYSPCRIQCTQLHPFRRRCGTDPGLDQQRAAHRPALLRIYGRQHSGGIITDVFPQQPSPSCSRRSTRPWSTSSTCFPNENFLDTCSMIAGADASHQMTWGNGQINYGTTTISTPHTT